MRNDVFQRCQGEEARVLIMFRVLYRGLWNEQTCPKQRSRFFVVPLASGLNTGNLEEGDSHVRHGLS
jgi:hypothetical protein